MRTRSPGLLDVSQTTLAGTGKALPTGTTRAGARRLAAAVERDEDAVNLDAVGGAGGSAADDASGAGSGAVSIGAMGSLRSTTGSGPGCERQGCQLVSRAKASCVGLVIISALGMDCMQPDISSPMQHNAARLGIDRIIASSCSYGLVDGRTVLADAREVNSLSIGSGCAAPRLK